KLGRRDAPVAGDVAPIVDQIAGTRSRAGEQIRAIGERLSEPAQQCAALLQSDQRISGIDLKMARKRLHVDVCERDAVDPPRPTGVGRERPGAEYVEARDG